MSFLEWFGSIAATVLLVYAGLAIGFVVGAIRRADMEGLVTGLIGGIIGGVAGLLLALWTVWSVDLLPFIGG